MAATYYLFTDGSRWERLATTEQARDKAGIIITVSKDAVSYMLGDKHHSLPRSSIGSSDEDVVTAVDAQLTGLLREDDHHESHEASSHQSSYEKSYDDCDTPKHGFNRDDAYQVAEECCRLMLKRQYDDLENELETDRIRVAQLEGENKHLRCEIDEIKARLCELQSCNELLKARCNDLLMGLKGVLDLNLTVKNGQVVSN